MTISLNVRGAAGEFRILDGKSVAHPGKASFAPRPPGDTSRAFTFVIGNHVARCDRISVQWRSPSGSAVTVNQSAIVWSYQTADKKSC